MQPFNTITQYSVSNGQYNVGGYLPNLGSGWTMVSDITCPSGFRYGSQQYTYGTYSGGASISMQLSVYAHEHEMTIAVAKLQSRLFLYCVR